MNMTLLEWPLEATAPADHTAPIALVLRPLKSPCLLPTFLKMVLILIINSLDLKRDRNFTTTFEKRDVELARKTNHLYLKSFPETALRATDPTLATTNSTTTNTSTA